MISPGQHLTAAYVACIFLHALCGRGAITEKFSGGNASIIKQIIRTVQCMLRVKQISESAFNQRLTLASKQWGDVLRLFHVIKRSLH